MASTGDTRRFIVPMAGVGMAYAVTWLLWSRYPGDWGVTKRGAAQLADGNLRIYAEFPEIQMGPVALLGGLLPKCVYMAAVSTLLAVALLLVVNLRGQRGRIAPALTGALMLAWPWAALGMQGHGDEAIVITCALGIVAVHRSACPRWLLVPLFALAVAAKPTAVVFLPLTFLAGWQIGLAALFAGGLVWLPFFLVDPAGFLASGAGQSHVLPGSLPNLLGYPAKSGYPDWIRPAQLAGGLGACLLLGRRGHVAAAVAAALAVRAVLEPGAWDYYSTGVIAAALAVDIGAARRFPWVTLAAFTSFLAAFDFPLSNSQGLARSAALLLTIAVCASLPHPRKRRAMQDGLTSGECSVNPIERPLARPRVADDDLIHRAEELPR